MRFVSRFNSIDYVVQPAQHQFSALGNRMPNTPSVTAKFSNHMFDSAQAQKKEHWSDAIRENVEQHLQAHGDMAGGGLYVEGLEPESMRLTPEQLARGLACVATLTAPDGSTRMCGKRPVIRDDMCAEHVALFLPTEAGDEEPGEQFECEVCGKGFAKEQGKRMHKMRAHPDIGTAEPVDAAEPAKEDVAS
jgi:hypothetical protein